MTDNQEFIDLLTHAYDRETTRSNYMHRMNRLLEICKTTSMHPILQHPDTYYTPIREAYPNITTRKNAITLILSFFKHDPKLKDRYKDAHARWSKFHDDMDGLQSAKYAKNMPDLKQLSKYTPMEEIQLKYREMKKGNPHETRATSQYFVFLSILLNTPPKRSDYGQMRIYYVTDPNKTDENYLVLREKGQPSYMVFTKYKTSKEYMRVDEELNKTLYKDIVDSLRRHPRKHLFVTRTGDPFASNDGFSKYVIKMFSKLFGRDTGVTMLRHVYITEVVDANQMSIEERNDIAGHMLHSRALQEKYKWKKEAVCSAVRRLCKECSK